MRNCQPNFVPKLSSLSTPRSSRSSALADQLIPAPAKNPLLACQVAPNISVDCSGRFDVTSGTLPSVPKSDAGAGATVRVTTSSLKISPYHSVVNFSGLRVGNCAPMPNGMPLD